ncbi:hypothetical protein [Nonomuraea turkmeniaca]|uniref:hypothetical protein n=1 Tax=Nonomuraea turkmeniaca TaxID=103838 RepID=UPI001B85EC89|nr:hypothetical protein [Nonomuraea turkmeniaca]
MPVGFQHHKRPVDPGQVFGMKTAGWTEFWADFDELVPAVQARRERAEVQMRLHVTAELGLRS